MIDKKELIDLINKTFPDEEEVKTEAVEEVKTEDTPVKEVKEVEEVKEEEKPTEEEKAVEEVKVEEKPKEISKALEEVFNKIRGLVK